MKAIGLFKELEPHGHPGLPSIHDALGRLDPEVKDQVVSYLQSGQGVDDTLCSSRDPLDPTKSFPGGPSLVSDGEFVWREDLQYFVERYAVALDDEFVARARGQSTSTTPLDYDAASHAYWYASRGVRPGDEEP